jgi:hypothetical protein
VDETATGGSMYLYSYSIKICDGNDTSIDQPPRKQFIDAPTDRTAMEEVDDIRDALKSVDAIVVKEKLEEVQCIEGVFISSRTLFENG